MNDFLWGVLMAMSVALVPNAIQVIVHVNRQTMSFVGKIWIVASMAIGAALFAPFLFDLKASGSEHGMNGQVVLPLALACAGTIAAAYFIALIGLRCESGSGLGAGLAEVLDNSLAPFFLMLIVWVMGGSARLSFEGATGIVFVVAGLVVLGLMPVLAKGPGSESMRSIVSDRQTLMLVGCGVIAALGTAMAVYFLRMLVREYGASVGFAVAWRYGGPAIAFLALARWKAGNWICPNSFGTVLGAMVVGGTLIATALYASVQINSVHAMAAAMALIPLLALSIEMAATVTGLVTSQIAFASPKLWVGFGLVALGVAVLNTAS